MAAGEYISVSSQKDTEEADVEKERQQQEKGPETRRYELEELAQIYVCRGLEYPLAKQARMPAPFLHMHTQLHALSRQLCMLALTDCTLSPGTHACPRAPRSSSTCIPACLPHTTFSPSALLPVDGTEAGACNQEEGGVSFPRPLSPPSILLVFP